MRSKTKLSVYCIKRRVNLVTSRKINMRLARPIRKLCTIRIKKENLLTSRLSNVLSDECRLTHTLT